MAAHKHIPAAYRRYMPHECNCAECRRLRDAAYDAALHNASRALHRSGAKLFRNRVEVNLESLMQAVADEIMVAAGVVDDDIDEALPGEEFQTSLSTETVQ